MRILLLASTILLMFAESVAATENSEFLGQQVKNLNLCNANNEIEFTYEHPLIIKSKKHEDVVFVEKFDLRKVAFNETIALKMDGVMMVFIECRNESECIYNGTRGSERSHRGSIMALSGWDEDCSVFDRINIKRAILNLAEYSEKQLK